MLTSLDFGQGCVNIVRTLFSCSSSFFSVNNSLSLSIHIHRLIRSGCPLAPYLYVLTANALGYLLEATLHQGKIRRVSLLRENEMVNNHFIYVYYFYDCWEKIFFNIYVLFDFFYKAFGAIVSEHKTNYWIIGIDNLPKWIPKTSWKFLQPSVIVRYLGILFGVNHSLVSMWGWCLERLQWKLLFWQFIDMTFLGKLTMGSILVAKWVVICWKHSFPS